jgi:four helix bundle protein
MANIEANRQLEERTLLFALAVIRFVSTFPRTDTSAVITRQLVRSGTSIGSNYREANRSESGPDFVHRTAICVKEASETDYWGDLCTRADLGDPAQRSAVSQEARELLAIFTTINRRAKGR